MTPSPIHATCAIEASSKVRAAPPAASSRLQPAIGTELVLDGLSGECELLARAPLVRHVVDDDGLAHAVDLAPLEAVIGDVGRDEHERTVALEGRAADVAFVGVVDVGAKRCVARG